MKSLTIEQIREVLNKFFPDNFIIDKFPQKCDYAKTARCSLNCVDCLMKQFEKAAEGAE